MQNGKRGCKWKEEPHATEPTKVFGDRFTVSFMGLEWAAAIGAGTRAKEAFTSPADSRLKLEKTAADAVLASCGTKLAGRWAWGWSKTSGRVRERSTRRDNAERMRLIGAATSNSTEHCFDSSKHLARAPNAMGLSRVSLCRSERRTSALWAGMAMAHTKKQSKAEPLFFFIFFLILFSCVCC